ncbi:hypothetical protein H4R18_002667 [Coemansia javaensis]|uniref:Fluoride ion transporter CrcB n=1 Tax=Coemansia javaensis TaxID=2761396 RepID=A0A9W8LIF1_9FUNG|nr:hypothetical protein H4R18_002667 [Coemansia javaensis]
MSDGAGAGDTRSTEPPPPLRQAAVGPAVGGLVLSSMAGVLIRVYLTRLFTYAGQPIYGLVWAQMAGCLIMGAAVQRRAALARWSPALALGVTTGLCGSITTFSSWQLLVFWQFFNTDGSDHSHFRNFLGGASVLASTLACAIGALRLGQLVAGKPRRRRSSIAAPPESSLRPAVDAALVALGVAAAAAASVVVGVAASTRSVSIALLFGCVGTLARWQLARLNAGTAAAAVRGLPLGTFTANALGCAVLAVVHVLQTGAVAWPSKPSCDVLAALADGLCGCLTTVSTFAVEIVQLPPKKSVLYAALSIVAGQAFFLLVAGIYFKTATVDYATCLPVPAGRLV